LLAGWQHNFLYFIKFPRIACKRMRTVASNSPELSD
jgi:hypothetical protein